jgi:hypothetical protein
VFHHATAEKSSRKKLKIAPQIGFFLVGAILFRAQRISLQRKSLSNAHKCCIGKLLIRLEARLSYHGGIMLSTLDETMR